MPELTRSQALVYGAIAVAVLLLGARWLRQADDAPASAAPAVAEASDGAEGASFSVERGGGDVIVHVAGAVREPGVYRLPEGSRVTDAVERAGGATARAAPNGINLAARLADGQQVVVPGGSEAPAGIGGEDVSTAAGAAAGTAAAGPISLGTASAAQLDTIEGIGPVTAGDILEYRDRNGGVASIEELDEISGIGPATMEALRESLQP